MSMKKWLILIAVGMAVCVTTAAIVVVVWFMGLGNVGADRYLPVYTSDQVPSAHPGYRRTTITSGTSVYVNDYDEYPLQLENRDPTDAVGRTPFGNGKICAIPGQKPTDYLAADVGSEMPAYEVFRNSQLPPFDWRHATFQKMQFTMPIGPAANKLTTDRAIIEDVVATLRDGRSTNLPPPSQGVAAGTSTNLYGVYLFSDQLPGLLYCAGVYIDNAGHVYLAEDSTTSTQWRPASPLFAKWTQTR